MLSYKSYMLSPVGVLELIAKDEGLISLNFVKEELRSQSHPILDLAQQELKEYFAHERQSFSVPLYTMAGTSFQQEVWAGLKEIPYAKTCSYKELAEMINHPKAYRAVGNANNRNPISIIVPCHRVIGADKSLVGYGGGLDKKEWLLNHEKSLSPYPT